MIKQNKIFHFMCPSHTSLWSYLPLDCPPPLNANFYLVLTFVWFVVIVVLDTDCFERLLGKCSNVLERSISAYRYLDDDLRTYFDGLQKLENLKL